MATRKLTGRKKNTKKKSGCLIWLIPLSLGLILILANKEVRQSLSRFIDSITSSGKKQAGEHRPERNPGLINRIISTDMHRREEDNLRLIRKQMNRNSNPKKDRRGKQVSRKSHITFKAVLYFVRYNAARDSIRLTPVARTIRRTKTPAYTVLQTLIRGPLRSERRKNLNSLIPRGTRIRRLHVKNKILYIDFNRAFLSRQKFGKEGLILQIYQIVNSMCRFPTVSGVRFTIEGKSISTAGGDWIQLNRTFRPKLSPI